MTTKSKFDAMQERLREEFFAIAEVLGIENPTVDMYDTQMYLHDPETEADYAWGTNLNDTLQLGVAFQIFTTPNAYQLFLEIHEECMNEGMDYDQAICIATYETVATVALTILGATDETE